MYDLISLYVPQTDLTTHLEQSEKLGKYLYNKNNNYRTIVNCMEHPEFRKFFDENFSNWENVKDILLFLKLYQEIEKSSPVILNGYQKLSILDNIMKDSKMRQNICKEVDKITQVII